MSTPVTVTLPALVRIPNVEIIHAGDTPASVGPQTLTKADIAGIVQAGNDPDSPNAVLKIGHDDPRFDGEPGYGRLVNYRLSADGSAVVVDIVGVPAPVAHLMPGCWPSRSVEMVKGHRMPQERLHKHPWVVTAVSLLGVTLPTITRLEDVQAVTGQTEVMTMPDAKLSSGLAMQEVAEQATTALAKMGAFLHDLVTDAGQLAAIYEDEGRKLWQAPISVAKGMVTLGDAVEVARTYTPTAKLSAASGPRPLTIGVTPMTTDERLDKLETALSSLTEMLAGTIAKFEANTATLEDEAPDLDPNQPDQPDAVEPDGPTAPDGSEDSVSGADDAATGDQQDSPETTDSPAPSVDDLTAHLAKVEAENDALKAAKEALEKELATHVEFKARMVREQRDAVLSAAVKDGRISPANRGFVENWAAKDPDGCMAYLSALQPTHPTVELGYADSTEGDTSLAQDLLAGSPWATTN